MGKLVEKKKTRGAGLSEFGGGEMGKALRYNNTGIF